MAFVAWGGRGVYPAVASINEYIHCCSERIPVVAGSVVPSVSGRRAAVGGGRARRHGRLAEQALAEVGQDGNTHATVVAALRDTGQAGGRGGA